MSQNKRRKQRQRCRIKVEVTAAGRLTTGNVVDLSETGMRLSTDMVLDVWRGDTIQLRSPELGLLQGTVRWRTPRMLGVELHGSTNTSAKLESYFKMQRV